MKVKLTMAKNRKAAEKIILDSLAKMKAGAANIQMHVDLFKRLDDKAFDQLMQDIRSGKRHLRLIFPNFGGIRINVKACMGTMRELGKEPLQRVWVPEKAGVRSYLTPNRYLIVYLPQTRQAQLLSKKISVAKHNRSVDQISGQAAGDSKSAKLSAPELPLLAGNGLHNNMLEFVKVRGGDSGAYNAMNAFIDATGEFSISQIEPYATGVQSGKALDQYFRAAHIKTTLNQ